MIPIDDLGGRVPAHAVESEPIDFPINLFLKCNLSNFYDSLQVRFVRSTPTCQLPAQNKRWGTWEHGNDQLEDDCDDEGLLRKDDNENGDGHGYDADD